MVAAGVRADNGRATRLGHPLEPRVPHRRTSGGRRACRARGASRMMNPEDARARGLTTGDPVRVESRAGAVDARLEVTANVRPGVVSLPHGFGHAVAKDTLRVAGTVAGPNMNAVTDDAVVEPLTGTAVLSGVPVSVAPASAT